MGRNHFSKNSKTVVLSLIVYPQPQYRQFIYLFTHPLSVFYLFICSIIKKQKTKKHCTTTVSWSLIGSCHQVRSKFKQNRI